MMARLVRSPSSPILFKSPSAAAVSVMHSQLGEYHCIIELDNGERYSVALKTNTPPEIEWFQERFRNHPKVFSKLA